MPNAKTILTRQDLLELVWAKPVAHVAIEHGVKPAAVLKACEYLNVRRPTTGHWSKIEFGKAPNRPSLPPTKPGMPESTTFAEQGCKRKRQPKTVHMEEVGDAAPEVDPIKWHVAVQKTRSALRGGAVDYKYGTLNGKPGHFHLRLSVTPGCLERGLQLLNRLAWLLEEAGFKFVMPKAGKTLIKLVYGSSETELEFYLRENVERYERELKPEEKGRDRDYIWNRWKYRPTGKLKLHIAEYYPRGGPKSWGDGKNTWLETKLADAVTAFAVCAKEKHVQELESQARQIRWKEEERIRQEAEARKHKEAELRTVLVTAATNWSTAERLRAFRGACEARLRRTTPDGALIKPQEDWLTWVDKVITDTDPLTAGFLEPLETRVNPAFP